MHYKAIIRIEAPNPQAAVIRATVGGGTLLSLEELGASLLNQATIAELQTELHARQIEHALREYVSAYT